MSMWDVSDMRDDVYEHMRVVRGRLLQAGIPEAQAPRYAWKDAKAGTRRMQLFELYSELGHFGYPHFPFL